MIKDSLVSQRIIILFILFFFAVPASALEPLSQDELYDTSGQATPTVSIKYSDDLTIDYFNQNVFTFEPRGEQYVEFSGASWIDPDTEKALVFNWNEPVRMIFEFDKYQYYPEGLYVSVSDLFRTGADGRTLPEYAEFENIPYGIIPPDTTYLRTWSSATTLTVLSNQFDIALVGTKIEYEDGQKVVRPLWEAAKDPSNQLLSVFWAQKTRTEAMGYFYIWTHQ